MLPLWVAPFGITRCSDGYFLISQKNLDPPQSTNPQPTPNLEMDGFSISQHCNHYHNSPSLYPLNLPPPRENKTVLLTQFLGGWNQGRIGTGQ